MAKRLKRRPAKIDKQVRAILTVSRVNRAPPITVIIASAIGIQMKVNLSDFGITVVL